MSDKKLTAGRLIELLHKMPTDTIIMGEDSDGSSSYDLKESDFFGHWDRARNSTDGRVLEDEPVAIFTTYREPSELDKSEHHLMLKDVFNLTFDLYDNGSLRILKSKPYSKFEEDRFPLDITYKSAYTRKNLSKKPSFVVLSEAYINNAVIEELYDKGIIEKEPKNCIVTPFENLLIFNLAKEGLAYVQMGE